MFKRICLLLFSVFSLLGYKAVIVEPVVDFMGNWTSDFGKNSDFYYQQPCSPQSGFTCSRIYQGLFNEVVDVIEENGDECKFHYGAVFYLKEGKIPCDEFYALKKYLKPISEFDINVFPEMPNYKTNHKFSNSDEIVLIQPFSVQLNDKKVIFSPGTRFKIDTTFGGNVAYKAYSLNDILFVPMELALQFVNQEISNEGRIADFIKLLQLWANSGDYFASKDYFTPYVYGGSSGLPMHIGAKFKLVQDGDKSYWDYPDNKGTLKSGFDCSALICRAAQTIGLPFYFRNTTTIKAYLHSINSDDFEIENGDIIFFVGHVLVISDVQQNKCIHANGYSSGYGCVVESELKDIFKDINTFNDLNSAYFNKSGLNLLDKSGKVVRFVPEFSILKFMSSNQMLNQVQHDGGAQ